MNCDASEQLPFFVYGTLIPGQTNDHLWREGIRGVETAVLTNGRLYDMGYYPMLVLEGSGTVQGKLITVASGCYGEILKCLDDLEGYIPDQPSKSTYMRLKRGVTTDDGRKALSWVYVGRPDYVGDTELIACGDWIDYAAGLSSQLDSWWENVITVHELHDGMKGGRS